jgi:hypothetical protein
LAEGDSKRALAHYDSLLRTAAVRLERLADPVAQIKEMFEAERSGIEAELDLTRAYRQDLLNELLRYALAPNQIGPRTFKKMHLGGRPPQGDRCFRT